MKNFFVQNKKMWIGIGCGILAVVFIVGMVLLALSGDNHNNPNPTEPTGTTGVNAPTNPSDVTEPSGNVTDPSGTEPNGTEPGIGEPVEPDHPDDFDPDADPTPITPPVDPDTVLKPDVGDDELAMGDGDEDHKDDPTEPTKDPTFSGGSYTEPEEDAVIIPDPKPTPEPEPEPEPEYDFTGITAGNITYEVYSSWSRDKQRAFNDYINESWSNLTLDDIYNVYCATDWQGGYDCGVEGHYCSHKSCHDEYMKYVEEGCMYCGSHGECAAFTREEVYGTTTYDAWACPEYKNVCEACGLPNASGGESGEMVCSKVLNYDEPCSWCGEMIYVGKCHNCIKP